MAENNIVETHKYGEYVKIPVRQLRIEKLKYNINRKLNELNELLKELKEVEKI